MVDGGSETEILQRAPHASAGVRPALADLSTALERLGIDIVGPLPPGLSRTLLYETMGPDGRGVVKVLGADPAAVDGHDLHSFRLKPRQVAFLRRMLPAVAELHVPVLHELDGDGWSAHIMPWAEGEHLLQNPSRSRQRLLEVVETLCVRGWQERRPSEPGNLARTLVGRIWRRWSFLEGVVPAAALAGRGMRVNSVACRPLREVLAEAAALLPPLEPAHLAPPVHGDLNTRNVVMGAAGVRLIDPRGSLEDLDPCYDVGKLLLSVSMWDAFADGSGSGRVVVDGEAADVQVPTLPGRARLLADLPSLLADSHGLPEALGPRWPARLALVHACHTVAEAACRVSDARAKCLPPATIAHHACAFLLVGLVLLEDAVARVRGQNDVDLADHLQLMSIFYGSEV
ncbi:phosphotransferase [Microlunatus phosphovorus]|nr:phosphotransferase [Microlunatus phosphovorus]